MHQGYELKFFELNVRNNPPVMEWYEGSDKGIVVISDSFEDFLYKQIELHAQKEWFD
ncbi:hypothetical protein GC102_37490 [Paenibacillus sp. LMG 31460]|uniref:SMI1/KNR4 family protein n=1 Tax=Paenibacillus germinis TaxID=2654979 RepID=A0ABX1ZET9_9BACL|nr:hypothetical protein [Paenibacillus germinis]